MGNNQLSALLVVLAANTAIIAFLSIQGIVRRRKALHRERRIWHPSSRFGSSQFAPDLKTALGPVASRRDTIRPATAPIRTSARTTPRRSPTGWNLRALVVGGGGNDIEIASSLACVPGVDVGIVDPSATPPPDVGVMADRPDSFAGSDLVVVATAPSARADVLRSVASSGVRTSVLVPAWGDPDDMTALDNSRDLARRVVELAEPCVEAMLAFTRVGLGPSDEIEGICWRKGSAVAARRGFGSVVAVMADAVATMLEEPLELSVDTHDETLCSVSGTGRTSGTVFSIEAHVADGDTDHVRIETFRSQLTWRRAGREAVGSVRTRQSAGRVGPVELNTRIRLADFGVAWQILDPDRPLGLARSRRLADMAPDLRAGLSVRSQSVTPTGRRTTPERAFGEK
ncbi:MAG: hypothetical protein GY925_17505 [Actinomycetia bacterium]|nr:hypothetical protein [Actinomycetes bacterium]